MKNFDLFVVSILFVVFVAFGILMLHEWVSAPCEYFANSSIKNVPIRCLGYFGQ